MAPTNCESHHSQATLLETQGQFCVSNFLDMKLHFQLHITYNHDVQHLLDQLNQH